MIWRREHLRRCSTSVWTCSCVFTCVILFLSNCKLNQRITKLSLISCCCFPSSGFWEGFKSFISKVMWWQMRVASEENISGVMSWNTQTLSAQVWVEFSLTMSFNRINISIHQLNKKNVTLRYQRQYVCFVLPSCVQLLSFILHNWIICALWQT